MPHNKTGDQDDLMERQMNLPDSSVSSVQVMHGYDLICMFNLAGDILYAYGNGWHNMGMSIKSLMLMNISEIFSFDTSNFSMMQERPFRIETAKLTDGKELFFEHIIMPSVANGEYYCMSKNITKEKLIINELKDKVTALTERISQLEARDKNKNKILSVLSHDLRNPITSISTLAGLIENGDIESDLKQSIHEMRDKLSAASDIISGMLEWASRSFTMPSSEPGFVDLAEISGKCVSGLSQMAGDKHVTIHNNIPAPLTAIADADQVSIVLRNIIQNAIKFTAEGGSVTVGGQSLNRSVILTVTDTGIGMTKKQMAEVFTNPVTSQGTNGEKGFGMGLIMCKEYIESNNGALFIESEPGQGTIITITLPR
jgi:signal transduction histidine kinase